MTAGKWHAVGAARVTKIQDTVLAVLTPEQLLPEWDSGRAVQCYPQCNETLDTTQTKVPLSIHAWLIEDRGRKILVDTGVGNDKPRPAAPHFDHLHTGWLNNLRQAGVQPEEIDFVLLTHLHVDHVGWNTRRENDHWVPTFPNARYLFSKEEYQFFKDPANNNGRNQTSFITREDSIDPIVACGLADQIDVNGEEVLEGVSFHSTPGHTAHHASIVLRSGTEHLLFTGDVMHHPVQVSQPGWNAVFDANPQLAMASRQWALEYAARHDATVFTSHFPLTSVGRVGKDHETYRWSFL